MIPAQTKKIIFISLGCFSLILGFIGIFLPIMPTTPFVLLAAYFFSKGSEKLHAWLLANKHFGPSIKEWEEHGVIDKKSKALATFTIVSFFSATLYFVNVSLLIKGIVASTGIAVLAFVLSRPSSISS